MPSEKILVVDDEEHIRQLCLDVLGGKGYHAEVCADPRDAVERLERSNYNLLLADIKMPQMNGFELLGLVKEISHDITVVMITGYATIENAINSLKLGAHGFVLKPFTAPELIQAVEDALDRNKILKENIRLKLLIPLFDISKDLLLKTNVQTLLDHVAEVVHKETGSDTVSLMLIDEEKRELTISASRGIPQEIINTTKKMVGEMIAGWVAEKGEPLVITEGIELDPTLKDVLHRVDLSTSICMPLISKGKVIGVMNLSKKKGRAPFAESDIEFVSILCGQVAIVIENARLIDALKGKAEELKRSYFESIMALAQAIETKDSYTRGHCDRTVRHGLAIADRLGLSDSEKEKVRYAAALHDIGKIGINESILNKPGKLTEEEYEMVKLHPKMGADIIKGIKFLEPVVPIIYHHQERYDGKGYPDGIKGEQIPIGARIIAVLDTYDAMTTDRPYRKALSKEAAIAEVKRCSGTQFDPQVVEVFLQILMEEDEGRYSATQIAALP